MVNVFCFYFDGAIVQVVKADISGGTVTIKDAHTFTHDELDGYLSGRSEKTFVVCCNPLLFHQDIVYLPPAAGRQYDKLVRSEVQKNHPELTSYTTFYSTVGQTTIDAKVFNKIAAFSYVDESITAFLSVFNHHGKVISHLYAAPYSIFRLIASGFPHDADQARIFIAYLPGEKFLLVAENNELEFIRKLPSSDASMLPADIQNVNMTIDYCFQTLRVKPVEAVVMRQSEQSDVESPNFTVPVTYSRPPGLEGVPQHILADYLAPLAAALHYATAPRSGDILPPDYVAFSRNKSVLTAGSALMVALALLLAGYTLSQWMVVSDLKPAVGALRTHLRTSGEEIAAYRKLDEEVKSQNKPLEILNKQRTSLHPAAALASLTLPSSQDYSIKGISVQTAEGYLALQIDGDIDSSGFSNIQATFEWIIEQLGKIPGYSIVSSTLDIKLKTFKIQARYNGFAQKDK
ncbi:MAG: hypothetical protein WCP20_21430 [Desulfuromonadales bacterium]